jgi:23S rRNA pseudouridine1911/1915/1917 synthase
MDELNATSPETPPPDRSQERLPRVTRLVITPGQQPERIDLYITQATMGATRNKVQEAIVAGAVTVNGAPTKSNYRVRPGDVIEITLMKPPPIELIAQDIPIEIVYEDQDMVIVNKPAGMVTHPGYGNRDGTLVNAMLFHAGKLPVADTPVEEDGGGDDEVEEESDEVENTEAPEVRPGIVHRLDKETSGLMVVAKNVEAQSMLAKQFADRTAKREYWAVAWGNFKEDEGEIEGNIARDTRDRKRFAVSKKGGKYALTRYRVIERFEYATLIALRLATGRTHQIRVHCAHIGHPIFGDPTYGGRSVVYSGQGSKHRQHVANLLKLIDRQALHARMLGLKQPSTGEWMEFNSELPEDMQKLIEALRVAE